MLYGAEGKTLNTQQANKPLTNEMYIWKKKSVRKSRGNSLEMTQLDQLWMYGRMHYKSLKKNGSGRLDR